MPDEIPGLETEAERKAAEQHHRYILTDDGGAPQAIMSPVPSASRHSLLHRLWRGLQTGGVSFLYDD